MLWALAVFRAVCWCHPCTMRKHPQVAYMVHLGPPLCSFVTSSDCILHAGLVPAYNFLRHVENDILRSQGHFISMHFILIFNAFQCIPISTAKGFLVKVSAVSWCIIQLAPSTVLAPGPSSWPQGWGYEMSRAPSIRRALHLRLSWPERNSTSAESLCLSGRDKPKESSSPPLHRSSSAHASQKGPAANNQGK